MMFITYHQEVQGKKCVRVCVCMCVCTRSYVCVCALREKRAKADVTKCLQMLNRSEGYTSVRCTVLFCFVFCRLEMVQDENLEKI